MYGNFVFTYEFQLVDQIWHCKFVLCCVINFVFGTIEEKDKSKRLENMVFEESLFIHFDP